MNDQPESSQHPSDWATIRLGNVAAIRYGKAKPRTDGNVPVIGSGGTYAWTREPLVTYTTLIVGRKGAAGTVWLSDGPVWPSDTTFYLEWKDGAVDVHFAYRWLQLRPLSGEHAKTTLPSLQKPDLEGCVLPLPPLPEQRAIAHVLRTVQRAKEATEAMIAATRDLKRSMTQYLFTYGPLKTQEADKVVHIETDIGQAPSHWQVKRLEDIGTLQRGNDLPSDKRTVGPYPVAGSNGISGYHSCFVAHGPGVFVGRSGAVGKVTWVDENYWPLNTALWVKDFHSNLPRFVYYAFGRVNFSDYACGVSVPTLNRNLVHPIKIGIPSLVEQTEIVRKLTAVDRKLEVELRRKQALEVLFTTLLHNLMTGSVRLPPHRDSH